MNKIKIVREMFSRIDKMETISRKFYRYGVLYIPTQVYIDMTKLYRWRPSDVLKGKELWQEWTGIVFWAMLVI